MNRLLFLVCFACVGLVLCGLSGCTIENEWVATSRDSWNSGNQGGQWGGRQRAYPRFCEPAPVYGVRDGYGTQDRVTVVTTPPPVCPPSYPTTILITNGTGCLTITRIRVSGASATDVIFDRNVRPGEDAEISFAPYGSGEILLVATLENDAGQVMARDSQRYQLVPHSTRPIEWIVRSTVMSYDGQSAAGLPVGSVDCPDCPKRIPER